MRRPTVTKLYQMKMNVHHDSRRNAWLSFGNTFNKKRPWLLHVQDAPWPKSCKRIRTVDLPDRMNPWRVNTTMLTMMARALPQRHAVYIVMF